jgi:hypothetical protein
VLQAGKLRVCIPMRLLHFLFQFPPSRSMAMELTQRLTETSTRKCFLGIERGRSVRLTTTPTSVGRLSTHPQHLTTGNGFAKEVGEQ